MPLEMLIPGGFVNFIWALFRVAGLLMVAPVFGVRLVPTRIRLALCVAITLVIAPLLPSGPRDPSWPLLVWISIQETMIGVAMGFGLQMIFDALITAGQTIAMSMGLGFAMLVDSQHGVSVPVLSQFFLILGTLVFLSLNGHLAAIQLLVDSFRLLPTGQHLSTDGLWLLVGWGSAMFAGALKVALPAIVAILVVNIAFGVVSRAAPSLNLFSVGFPATLLLGFMILLFSINGFTASFTELLTASLDNMMRVLAP
jgi:flagellar biosynthesis protein FliR